MAQLFWGIYAALHDNTSVEQAEFDSFTEHIRWELTQKHVGFTGQSLARNPQLLEELLQHVCGEIAIGIKRGNFDPAMNTFKNWVDGLVRNTLRKHYERQQKERTRNTSLDQLIDAGGELQLGTDCGPELEVINAEEIAELQSLLKQALKLLRKHHPKYYQVLYSRCFDSLTTGETAKLLGTTNEDVSRTLERAKRKLTELVETLTSNATTKPKMKRKRVVK